MCHSGNSNNSIGKIQEQALRIVYDYFESNFKLPFLSKLLTLKNYQRQLFARMYKFRNNDWK